MSDSDDDYVEYGNALEPIEEDAVPKKKPVSLEDQVVTDAQGRRRFHGAFTGGFSAGFFNTVGSLEGWTPSSFKSSRSERMGSKIQKPRDFMDDEDIGEFGIAPQVLRATDDFNHLKRNRERGPRISDGPIPGEPVLKLLLEPVRETVGLRILRRMGWRPGQGVGPRVVPRMKKRLVGCTLPPGLRPAGDTPSNSSASSEDDDAAAEAGITFAPQDVPSFLVSPKTDKFGLGYRGLDRRPVLSSTGSAAAPRRVVLGGGRGGTVSVAGQAFGVGALEEDDEDIYALEDMSQYDFALSGPATSRTKADQPSAAQAGSSLLETFTKAVRVSVREHFPPPTLPKDFAPVLKVRKSRFDQPPPGAPVAPAPARVRSADERAALVGERGERLAQAGEEGGCVEEEDEVRERERLRAEALKLTASLAPPAGGDGAGAAGRFAPFAGHPDKQRRYEQFLALRRAGQPGKLSHLQPLSMTEWERRREMTEFEQAARLFQPLSADMGERFVSASQSDDSINPMAPVEKTLGATPEQRSAAKMKMFGQMTRTQEPWQPCDLLCKRFNIAKPTVSAVPKDSQNRKKVSVFDFLKAAPHNAVQNKPCKSISASSPPTTEVLNTYSKTTPLQEIEKPIVEEATSKAKVSDNMESSDTQQKEGHETTVAESKITEDFPFPEPAEKIDLFKAIFLSSSESESEQEEKEESEQYGTSSQKDKIPSAELSHLVASAPADVPALLPETQKRAIVAMPAKSGVFANLDLDALLSQPTKKDELSSSKSKDTEILKTNSESLASSQDNVYGPRLPSTLSAGSNKVRTLPSVVAPLQRSSPICEWVESSSSHKKKKKDKKHKDKKHKSSKHKKHKHKK